QERMMEQVKIGLYFPATDGVICPPHAYRLVPDLHILKIYLLFQVLFHSHILLSKCGISSHARRRFFLCRHFRKENGERHHDNRKNQESDCNRFAEQAHEIALIGYQCGPEVILYNGA
ncbi:hypothetical protein, partial [Intestinimonas butyriciproducens]|uniref:hypothetical protein n=1 Tax=Intestinimonas butyriciproducens TaxID=1297617 RepID=UPI001A9BBBA2